eukprot:m.178676 g.178676  ORF g.178676 m.178676 type:complete len:364 (-) comp14595_c0_seq1:1436-2527(-)
MLYHQPKVAADKYTSKHCAENMYTSKNEVARTKGTTSCTVTIGSPTHLRRCTCAFPTDNLGIKRCGRKRRIPAVNRARIWWAWDTTAINRWTARSRRPCVPNARDDIGKGQSWVLWHRAKLFGQFHVRRGQVPSVPPGSIHTIFAGFLFVLGRAVVVDKRPVVAGQRHGKPHGHVCAVDGHGVFNFHRRYTSKRCAQLVGGCVGKGCACFRGKCRMKVVRTPRCVGNGWKDMNSVILEEFFVKVDGDTTFRYVTAFQHRPRPGNGRVVVHVRCRSHGHAPSNDVFGPWVDRPHEERCKRHSLVVVPTSHGVRRVVPKCTAPALTRRPVGDRDRILRIKALGDKRVGQLRRRQYAVIEGLRMSE